MGNVYTSTALPKQFQEVSKFVITKEVRSSILSDKTLLLSSVVSLFFLSIQIFILAIGYRNLPPEIPIFYSVTWGEAILGKTIFIWILPSLGLLFFIINFIISFIFFKHNIFLIRTLFVSSFIINFCALWGTLKIVTLLL